MQSYLLFYLRFSWGASPTCDHGTAASRDYENFFSNDAHRPNPFHPVERARESRCIGSLGIVPIQLFKVENNFYPMRFYSMCLNAVERSRRTDYADG